MSTKSNVDSASSTTARPTKRRRLASPIELAQPAPEPALVTPDDTITTTSLPLPLTKRNLKLLSKMSSNPATPSSSRKRTRRSPTKKSASGDTTTNSEVTSRSEPLSTSQSKVRECLERYRIFYNHEYYSTVPQLINPVRDIAITLRDSPGLSNERISSLQRGLNKMATSKEDTAGANLIKELFTTPESRDATTALHRVHNCSFIENCIPTPDTSTDLVLARALEETGTLPNPKPDFTFGVNPAVSAFTSGENDVNALEQVKHAARIVSDLQYPFFVVEWKSSFACGTHPNAASQSARSGAAIVSSMVKLYREAFPSISTTDLLTKTFSFSSTVDSYSAIIYVHWWGVTDGYDSWNMHIVASLNFLDQDPVRFRDFRRVIDNIMDWGMGRRLVEVKNALAAIRAAINLAAQPGNKGKQKA